ncbi:TonB-dependent receptor [Flavitalea sp. BT771]|uniref:TonB-dependent receptor n=1 Tax=Flavitalea sp. BT771 TaxID=3063329 RepID=UPI0026E18596|nr:TonB-dependent receptor [Flavitalea sp. BT771]MDO6431756.1 TonB-dependent receptor [Flavitalea sp. BT771]MDV6220664.1 TonB-dependent receptor [Flavitalea sp. BT771]
MKITALCMVLAGVHLSVWAFSQKTISLTVNKEPLSNVLSLIEQKTGYRFLYQYKDLYETKVVSLKVEEAPLEYVLSLVLKGTGLDYSINSNHLIVLSEASSSVAVAADPVTGIIRNERGEPLSNVSVLIRGTSKGTQTNGKGYFNLPASEGDTLQFSFVGYETQWVKVDRRSTFVIILKESNQQINEVVVVGYSDKRKSELTSAVTVVSAEKLKDVTTNDIGSMLQGKVAGLQVVNSSGVPGAAAEIRLRGVSSVNASQSPLFVVDGIIGGNYDPNDVENVTVLKDAGATAMYGSQANGGVIIITTKKAAAGKTRFEVKVTQGIRTPDFGEMKMMSGSQLYNQQKEYYRDYIPTDTGNSFKIDILKFYGERPLSLRDRNYNWLTTTFRHAPMTNLYASASGRTEKADYYVGLSYYNEKGTFLNTKYQRLNLRANSTYHFNKAIAVTNNINISGTTGKSYDYNDVYNAYLNLPWDNPYDSTGRPVYVDGSSTFKWWSRDKVNPIHTIQNSNHPYKNFDANYDLNANVTLTPWLSLASTNRVSAAYFKSTTYFSPLTAGQYHGNGYLSEMNTFNYGYISNDLLKFNFNLGPHRISGLAGVAFEGSHTELNGAAGKGLPVGLQVLNTVSNSQVVSGSNDQATLVSYISQVNYSYLDKYFLTGSYRVDGSSAFPSSHRYARFPAVSAGWLLSKEDFLANSRLVSNLKLRLSYGITGTQDIGSSRYLGLYSLSSQYNSLIAATPSQLPSPDLTWESKHQWNAGVDLGLFKRVDLTVDVYNNITRNLLLQVSQPLSVGFESRWENRGEIANKGIEIGLSTLNITTHDFEWRTDFSINWNTNKLRQFPAVSISTQSTWGISQIYRNGGNLYEFYMPKWMGVDPQTGAPLWEQITKDAAGKVIYRQATSNYDSATYQEAGSPLPKFQGGMTNSFRYKGITLSVNAYFLSGNKIFSNALRFVENDGSEPYYNQAVLPKGYKVWTKPGDIASEPSPQNANNSTQTSTRYLKDGSFLAIRNVTLSYDLPKVVIRKLKLDGVRVSLSADNVYRATKFFGQDPQTTITPGLYVMPGVSDFKYPNNRQYLFNIDFRF